MTSSVTVLESVMWVNFASSCAAGSVAEVGVRLTDELRMERKTSQSVLASILIVTLYRKMVYSQK